MSPDAKSNKLMQDLDSIIVNISALFPPQEVELVQNLNPS